MKITPGAIRVRTEPRYAIAVSNDVHIEVQLPDGSWMPLNHVCSLEIPKFGPNEPIIANLGVYLSGLDMTVLADFDPLPDME